MEERSKVRGPHVLTSVDVLAAANIIVELKLNRHGDHLCDEHREQIPGRHREAGAIAREASAE